jgi:hypothetical protein
LEPVDLSAATANAGCRTAASTMIANCFMVLVLAAKAYGKYINDNKRICRSDTTSGIELMNASQGARAPPTRKPANRLRSHDRH